MSRKISREALIENLKRMAERLGCVPKKEDLRLAKGSKYGASAYQREFGKISDAIIAADMKPCQIRGLSRQNVIDDLKGVYEKLGRTPQHKEYKKTSMIGYSFPTIKKLFGSWTKALAAAGLPIEKARNVTRTDIREALSAWRSGHPGDSCLEYWRIRKARRHREFPYSCNTIKAKFHPLSWQEIMWECGFPDYATHDHFISRPKRGDHTGLDGNEYLSSLERQIGDALFGMLRRGKIADYEYEAEVSPGRSWTCDFRIEMPNGNVLWLEADGMRGTRPNPYDADANEKIKHYRDAGMDFEIVSYSCANPAERATKLVRMRG